MKKKYPNILLKIILGFSIPLLILLILALLFLFQTKEQNKIVNDILDHPYTVSNSVRDINIHINAILRTMKDITLSSNETKLNTEIAKVDSLEQIIYERFQIVEERFLGDKEQIKEYKELFIQWKTIRDEVITLVQSDSTAKAVAVTRGKGARHVNKLMDYSQIITNFANNKAKTFNNESQRFLERSYFLIFLLTISALVLSALITFFFYRSVNRNLSLLVNRIRKVFERKGEYSAQKNEKNILKILDFSVYELEKSLKITEDYQKHLEKVVDERTIELTKELDERKKLQVMINNFFDQTMNLHLISTLDGTIIKVNPGWKTLLGYTKAELEGTNCLELVHPEDIESTKNEMKNLEKGITSFYFENRYRHKNGDYRIFAWSAVAYPKENHIYAVASDITEQKEAEKQIQKREAKFKALFENSPDLIALTDLDGNFIDINRVAEGYKKDDVIGTNVTYYLTEEQKKDFYSAVKESLETGKVKSYEPVITTPEGNDLHWFNRVLAVKDENEANYLVINFTDVTRQKLIEEELREYRENLELKVKEKTEDLESLNEELSSLNEELQSSNEELRSANEELEKYHELFIQREFRIKELRDKLKDLEG